MPEEERSCCFTGYRPNKFPFELNCHSRDYIDFENSLTNKIYELIEIGCTTFYSGMAMGFDIIAAEGVLLARESIRDTSVRLICAVPFIEQSSSYSDDWKERYDKVLSEADEVILISDKYFPQCYHRRNKFMVDRADYVITWFDGRRGGTKNTIDYALSKGRGIINLYDEPKRISDFSKYIVEK